MKKQLKQFTFFICAVIFAHCTAFKKEIKKPVTIKIVAPDSYGKINLNANYPKYVNTKTETDYQNKFMENLIAEGKATPSVTIDNNAQNPDYIIEVKYVTLTETDSLETVNDPQSPNNGKQYLINKVEASCEVICIDAKTNKQIGLGCTNNKSRQEKLNNNRDLGQLISGSNKDHKTYHEKTLDPNIALQLAGDVGRRVWVPITRRIKNSLK